MGTMGTGGTVMSELLDLELDLLEAAIKHGKHDQSSHGRRTARRRAYSAAYSSARAGGASPADARAAAREAGIARQGERDTRLERLRAYNTPEARSERERVAREKAEQDRAAREASEQASLRSPKLKEKSETSAQFFKRLNSEVVVGKPASYSGHKEISVHRVGDKSNFGFPRNAAFITQRQANPSRKREAEVGYTVRLGDGRTFGAANLPALQSKLTLSQARAAAALVARHDKPGQSIDQLLTLIKNDPDYKSLRSIVQKQRSEEE